MLAQQDSKWLTVVQQMNEVNLTGIWLAPTEPNPVLVPGR
jgi:hypothetical protein